MPYYPPAATGSGTPAVSVTDESSTPGIASAVGTSTNYARQDHTHGTQPLALSLNTLSSSVTLPANTSSVVVNSLTMSGNTFVTIPSTSALMIIR